MKNGDVLNASDAFQHGIHVARIRNQNSFNTNIDGDALRAAAVNPLIFVFKLNNIEMKIVILNLATEKSNGIGRCNNEHARSIANVSIVSIIKQLCFSKIDYIYFFVEWLIILK